MPRKAKRQGSKRPDLRGTWFQCSGPEQHLTESPVFLGDFTYCDRDACMAACVLVHSVHDDAEKVEERRRSWNAGLTRPSIGKLVKQIEDEQKPQGQDPVGLGDQEATDEP